MIRESVFVCSFGSGEETLQGRVLAWDAREAAELFARELEDEHGVAGARPSAIRVRRAEAPLADEVAPAP